MCSNSIGMRSKHIGTRSNKFGHVLFKLFGKFSKSIGMRSKHIGTRSNKFGTRFLSWIVF